jgi:hypothetical protein
LDEPRVTSIVIERREWDWCRRLALRRELQTGRRESGSSVIRSLIASAMEAEQPEATDR